jgi:hypothetical protein
MPHVSTYTYIHIYVRKYIHTHTYIYTYIHAYMHTYVRTYIYTYTYVHMYIHTYVHAYVYTYVHMYTYTHTYIHTCINACNHIYILHIRAHAHTHNYNIFNSSPTVQIGGPWVIQIYFSVPSKRKVEKHWTVSLISPLKMFFLLLGYVTTPYQLQCFVVLNYIRRRIFMTC